jgi:hypothetical protein
MKVFNTVRFFLTAGVVMGLFLLPGACGVLDEDIRGTDAAGLIPPNQAAIPVQMVQAAGRRAVLIRGNEWVLGLPGFPANAFAALYGEYRLEFPGEAVSAGTGSEGTGAGDPRIADPSFAEAPPDFYLWLSKENLYLPEDLWETRAGITGYTVQQRNEGDSLLAASVIDGGTDRDVWTVLFQFPQPAGITFSPAEINLLIRTWISRFRYFLSLAGTPADVSLPAVVNF